MFIELTLTSGDPVMIAVAHIRELRRVAPTHAADKERTVISIGEEGYESVKETAQQIVDKIAAKVIDMANSDAVKLVQRVTEMEAAIRGLLDVMPNSVHEDSSCWDQCWDALDETAQTAVMHARYAAAKVTSKGTCG